MGSLLCFISALALLLIPFWWLDRQRWAQFITRPMKSLTKRLLWGLVRGSFALLGKLLRMVASLFDPY